MMYHLWNECFSNRLVCTGPFHWSTSDRRRSIQDQDTLLLLGSDASGTSAAQWKELSYILPDVGWPKPGRKRSVSLLLYTCVYRFDKMNKYTKHRIRIDFSKIKLGRILAYKSPVSNAWRHETRRSRGCSQIPIVEIVLG